MKVTYIATNQIRGIHEPKDGAEHILQVGAEITLESEDAQVVELVKRGALVPKNGKPTK